MSALKELTAKFNALASQLPSLQPMMAAREEEERLTAVEDLQRELNTLQLELLREERK